MPTKTLEQLQAEVAEAQRKAGEAQRRAAERQAQEDRQREQRLVAYDRAVLAAYDDAQLEAEVLGAQERLRQAILADPVYAAGIDVHVAMIRRYYAHGTAAGTAARLGVPFTAPPPPAAWFTFGDVVAQILEREAGNRATAAREAGEQARVDAGEGR